MRSHSFSTPYTHFLVCSFGKMLWTCFMHIPRTVFFSPFMSSFRLVLHYNIEYLNKVYACVCVCVSHCYCSHRHFSFICSVSLCLEWFGFRVWQIATNDALARACVCQHEYENEWYFCWIWLIWLLNEKGAITLYSSNGSTISPVFSQPTIVN